MNQNEPTVTTGQSASTMKERSMLRMRGKRTRLVLALVLLAVVVAGAWFLATRSSATDYKYQKLDSVKLPGFWQGAAMTFDKPIEVQPVGKILDGQQELTLVHNITLSNKHTATLSYMGAFSSFNTMFQPRTQADYDNAQDGITNPATKNRLYRKNISDFIGFHINKRWTITLGQGKAIKTANLQHAWEVDFTGVDKNPKASYVPAKLKGEVIMAIGKNAYYYMMISAVNKNFDKNTAIWQQMVDSLKIDQQAH